jgi:hypothetical protein
MKNFQIKKNKNDEIKEKKLKKINNKIYFKNGQYFENLKNFD